MVEWPLIILYKNMKVILLKSVPKVGNKYDVVDVASGFATNSLFPRGLAEVATPKGLVRLAEIKKADEGDRAVREELLLKTLADVSKTMVEIGVKANEKGHLFAGLHKDELSAALKTQANFDISPEYIELKKPIKEIGEHKVAIKIGDKFGELHLNIKALE